MTVGVGLAIQNRAAVIKISAEQRAGELIAKIEWAQGKKSEGLRSALERSEIGVEAAHRWQKMAEVSPAKVREFEAELTEKGEELTSTSHLRPAKFL